MTRQHIHDELRALALADFARSLESFGVPEHLRDGLLDYVLDHHEPGHFLCAVLTNDLQESFARADAQSEAALGRLVSWLYNEAPAPCWGSKAKVDAWLAVRGVVVGIRSPVDPSAPDADSEPVVSTDPE